MSKVGQYIRSLHLNYDQPILIHITGHSNCGKTALSLIFYELISKKEVNDRPSIREITSGDKSASNVNLIMTDRFVHKIVTANPDKYDVANANKNHAGNFSNFDSNEHVRYNSLLRDAVSSNHKFVIIEGYCQFDEQQIFAGFDNIIRISTKKRGAYRLHNPKRFGFRRSRKVSAFASVSGERWEIFREKKAFKPVYDFAEQILDAIKQDVITNIVKPISKYQYFALIESEGGRWLAPGLPESAALSDRCRGSRRVGGACRCRVGCRRPFAVCKRWFQRNTNSSRLSAHMGAALGHGRFRAPSRFRFEYTRSDPRQHEMGERCTGFGRQYGGKFKIIGKIQAAESGSKGNLDMVKCLGRWLRLWIYFHEIVRARGNWRSWIGCCRQINQMRKGDLVIRLSPTRNRNADLSSKTRSILIRAATPNTMP